MNSFTFTTPSADRTVKEIMEKFEEYAIGMKQWNVCLSIKELNKKERILRTF